MKAEVIVAGQANSPLMILGSPLSFWGGVDVATGEIIDVHHPDCGRNVAGKILVMDAGRGSSSSSSVLAELIRLGKSPAALLLRRPDPILTVGLLVAKALYGKAIPLVIGEVPDLRDGDVAVLVATEAGCSIERR